VCDEDLLLTLLSLLSLLSLLLLILLLLTILCKSSCCRGMPAPAPACHTRCYRLEGWDTAIEPLQVKYTAAAAAAHHSVRKRML
jgi:hypothetical protein